MDTHDRIKQRRTELGLSADDVAKALNVSRATVYRYESNDIEKLPTTLIKPLSEVLRCDISYLMGWDESSKSSSYSTTNIPVLGRVAAGIPITATEDVIEYVDIPEAWSKSGEYFGLLIKGDSMEPDIHNGDIVIVRQQADAEDGDIVIAIINGDDGVCKRLQRYSSGIALISINPAYAPMIFDSSAVSDKPVTIAGKVVEIRRRL